MRLSQSHTKIAPMAYQALIALQKIVDESGMEPALLQLVALRASQINGCAFCCDYHDHEARHLGVAQQKLVCLPAFRDAPIYSPRERAALQWAEAVTLLAGRHIADEQYAELSAHFDERERVMLTYAIAVINTWNRLSIPFRVPPMAR